MTFDLAKARKFACGWTSRWGRLACAGNDGNPHEAVCDSLTYATDDVYQEFARALAAAEAQRDAALAEVERLRASAERKAVVHWPGFDAKWSKCGIARVGINNFAASASGVTCKSCLRAPAAAPPPEGTGT